MEPAIIVAVVTSCAAIISALLAWRAKRADNSQQNYDQLQEDVRGLRRDFGRLQSRYMALDNYVVELRSTLINSGIKPPPYPLELLRAWENDAA